MIEGSVPLTNGMDPDPGGSKTYESYGSGSGSATLSLTNVFSFIFQNIWYVELIALKSSHPENH
jgi:hypothetical protein